jgi:hypothetical protein
MKTVDGPAARLIIRQLAYAEQISAWRGSLYCVRSHAEMRLQSHAEMWPEQAVEEGVMR